MADAGDEALNDARQAIAAAFAGRARAVIDAWTAAIAAEPLLRTHRLLPRRQLEDHMPLWLEALARAFAAPPDDARSIREQQRVSEQHGEQRWRQGYDLHELTREWGSLHRCLVDEFERCAAALPDSASVAVRDARRTLAFFVSESTSDSAQEFFELQRRQASGSVHDLERALATVRDLERQQGELWRQAAHDLRGNLGVVANVTRTLGADALPPERRDDFLAMLSRNVSTLHAILEEVTELSRLQAGQEERRIGAFDAAALLRALADDVRPAAVDKGLDVGVAGPSVLEVEGDPVKVRRIAQNLIFNAIRYTERGGVTVAWGGSADAGSASPSSPWWFTIADTGPGLGAPGATPSQGEGLGLAIVRRLAVLLEGHVDVVGSGSSGTTFRVTLPGRYPAA